MTEQLEHQESVIKLVDELADKLAENRQIKNRIEELAHQIVDKENEKLQELAKYTDCDVMALIDQEATDDDTIINGSTDQEDLGQENLRLKIELQKLKEFESLSVNTIDKTEQTLLKLCQHLLNFSKGYHGSKKQLEQSYEGKLQEEKELEESLRRDNEKLREDLRSLSGSLKQSSEQINMRITKFQNATSNGKT